jgi:hypothetical protein
LLQLGTYSSIFSSTFGSYFFSSYCCFSFASFYANEDEITEDAGSLPAFDKLVLYASS